MARKEEMKWEDCWEYKAFTKIDKLFNKAMPYFFILFIVYLGFHLILYFTR